MSEMISKYLSYEDYQCHHCKKTPFPLFTEYRTALFEAFDNIVESLKIKVIVTSGWRCEEHQEELRKAGYKAAMFSPHFFSAIDFLPDPKSGVSVSEVVKFIEENYPKMRLGYRAYNYRFIHMDNVYNVPEEDLNKLLDKYPFEVKEHVKRAWRPGVTW